MDALTAARVEAARAHARRDRSSELAAVAAKVRAEIECRHARAPSQESQPVAPSLRFKYRSRQRRLDAALVPALR